MTADCVTVLSSMATRSLLSELAASFANATIESTAGLDAARRVRGGEIVDLVVLADGVMRALEAEGHIRPGTLHAIAVSPIAVAVRDGEARPVLGTADDVKQAVLAAKRIGISTGPSGEHLLRLFDQWGIRDTLRDRLVQAPPGVPVGRLLVEGTVDLGFQQRSELMGLAGVAIAGPLPQPLGGDTVFTAGVASTAARPDAAQALVAFLASSQVADAKRRHGMEPPHHEGGR